MVIPAEVEQFVVNRIESVAHLEALLLMRRESEKMWTDLELAKRLYIDTGQAQSILSHLCVDGFIVAKSAKPVGYQYRPTSQELAKLVDLTADAYSKYLVPVTNLVHSNAKSRVQKFADAFRLKREG